MKDWDSCLLLQSFFFCLILCAAAFCRCRDFVAQTLLSVLDLAFLRVFSVSVSRFPYHGQAGDSAALVDLRVPRWLARPEVYDRLRWSTMGMLGE